MSEGAAETEGAWTPPVPGPQKKAVDDAAVPQPVRDEEAFLDAVGSHTDEDHSGLEKLRDKVSEWYDTTDSISSEK